MGENMLLELGFVFAAIALVGTFARRIHLSVIPLYILVGLAMGDSGLGSFGLPHVSSNTFLKLSAELGIVFLLFFLGTEFSIDQLLQNRERILKAGGLDLLLNFPVGFLLGYAMFGSLLPAFVVAGIVYISSSAIITKFLIDMEWIANPESEAMLGVLVFEDLFIALYLASLSPFILGESGGWFMIRDMGLSFSFLLVICLLVYYGTALLERLLFVESNEAFVLQSVGIMVLVSGAALAAGISEAVAAFFVGTAFSGTSFVHELEKLLAPIRDIFASLFFFWIGLNIDLSLFPQVGVWVGVAVVVSSGTKMLSGYFGGTIYELSGRRCLRVALGMIPRGEFSLVIGSLAALAAEPVMRTMIPSFAVAYVLCMSILGALLLPFSITLESIFFKEP